MDTDFLEPEPGLRLRTARWDPDRGAARGDALLLNGRTEFVEKYDEAARRLAGVGFRVWSLDWRGQGLSTRLLPDPKKGHIDDYAAYLRDLDALVARVRTHGSGPRLILAHSMGGHIACRYLAEVPDHGIERLVLSAPMISPAFNWWQRPLAAALARLALRLGRGEAYALGQAEFSVARMRFEGNPLTRDRARFEALIDILNRRPDLQLGGVTWGWLAATIASEGRLTADATVERLTLPCLVLRAAADTVVDNARIASFAARLPDARLHDIADARHELLREIDPVRNELWRVFDDFCGIARG